MSGISTHVLDTARGEPARQLSVLLQRLDAGGTASAAGAGRTDENGRARDLLGKNALAAGRYRLVFDTASYFSERGVEAFFPVVSVEFEVRDELADHHVPLLLSPFGYSTYRGT